MFVFWIIVIDDWSLFFLFMICMRKYFGGLVFVNKVIIFFIFFYLVFV